MKNALRTLIFVLIMGTVSGSALVGINTATAHRIARNEELKLKTSILDVMELPYDKTNVLDIFDSQIKIIKKDNYTFYNSSDNAVSFEFRGSGLWGYISGIISLEEDLKTIRKIKITHQEETPGLGGRIGEKEYLSQFKGKEVTPKIIFVPEGKARQKNEVDAITGATGTSRAFEKLINENIEKYLAVLAS